MADPVPADAPIRVVVADDHPVVREGLRSFLSSRPGIDVVGEAGSADEVVAAVRDLAPDVVLVDLMMPGGGIEAIGRVRALTGGQNDGDGAAAPRLLVLTSFVGDDQVLPALRAGASGYLLKDVDPSDLEAAVRTVHRGGSVLGPEVASRVLDQATSSRPAVDARLAELTPRELDVLGLLGEGMSNRQIADALYVAEKTVKTHMSSILTKLRVTDRTQAALYAVRHGVAAPEA